MSAADQPDTASFREVAGQVLRILSGLLPPEAEVSYESSLRDYGISSLTMTRLWFQLRNELGVDIPVNWLGRCGSARELIERVSGEMAAGARPAEPARDGETGQDGRPELLPLTDMQQAYLLAKSAGPGGDPIGCHIYREFDIAGLDMKRLRSAWRRVVEQHEALRVVVTADGRQRVQEEIVPPEMTVHDRSGVCDAAFADHLAEVRDRLSHRRYEIGAWPMFTVEVSLSSRRAVVHLSIDALLTDGQGLEILLDDWWQWYHDPHRPAPDPGPSLADCSRFLLAEQRSADYRRHLDHWARRLADLPAGPSLGAVDPPAGASNRRIPVNGSLSPRQWQALRDVAARWEVSPTALILTLFAEALARQHAPQPFSLVLTTSDRVRLPSSAERVAGAFTSSIVFPVADTLGRPLRDAVQGVHRQLWEDLAHAAVSGVAALRHVRSPGQGGPPPPLGVVFTSMLGAPRGHGGFTDAVSYAVSQTTGVMLDHQMWERDGSLYFRWDAVPEMFPPGMLPVLFAGFVNSLRDVCAGQQEIRELNELQQAYHVSRAVTGSADWNGCQVYHSFAVAGLDVGRLEAAWLRLAEAYDVLRTVVSHEGTLLVNPAAPEGRQIPVIDLSGVDDPDAYLARMRETLVGRAFPLGRGPQSDLRVTTGERGDATVHCTLDLTIMDGRSIHFLLRELLRVYADPEAELPSSVPYRQYAQERAASAADARYRSWEAHWSGRAASVRCGPVGAAPAASVADRRRVRRQDDIAGWGEIRQAAERAGLTADDLLLAAFTEVLARHCATPFSIPVVRWTERTQAYRPGEYTALSWVTRETSSLPVWEQAAVFRRCLGEDAAADAVSGLGTLRRRVISERRAGRFELPVVYTGILDLSGQVLPPGIAMGPWMTCTPDVSLDCVAIEEHDELHIYWDAVESHFPRETLSQMFSEYRDAIRGLGEAAPASPVLSDEMRRMILYEWNDTDTDFPQNGPVHLLFEVQARRRPDAIALRWAGGTMTYAELNRRANQTAWLLRELGVGPETGVGISVPRGPDMVVSVLGVLKAGGFYVPLEPSLPRERAVTMIGEAGLSLVLTSAGRRGWPVPGQVLLDESTACPETDLEPVNSVTATAYVIFTSGSTGKPKGVAVSHRSLLNLLHWCYKTHDFGPGDVGLCVTSLGFDLSVFDILGLLGCGAGLYLADDAERKDPELLLDILLREPVTFWNSAPTTLGQLAPLFRARAGAPGNDTLRLVYLSGDFTPLSLPDDTRSFFPRARVVSLGGATEATVWSNWFEVGAVDPGWRSIPYGRPIDNARYYILDEAMEPCPVGIEGDLYIGGGCLSTGYYRQPDLTEQRFVPDPFGGGRLFRTGDRAYYRADGTICLRGRADRQVKVRGFRVELEEIEHRLRQHDRVKDVVVLAREDRLGDRKLAAYVVPAGMAAPPAGAASPSAAELRRHAAEGLPDYMVPNVIAFVDTFPATSNGKLDRDRLPWPVESNSHHVLSPVRADSGQPSAAPPGPAEGLRSAEEIATVFAQVLGVSAVNPDTDLWDQGATSFTMVLVSAELQKRYQRRVPVEVLLAEPTASGIARAIAGGGAGLETTDAVLAAGPPGAVEFFSAPDREAFKQARWDLRPRQPGESVLALGQAPVAEEHFAWRASHREFDEGPVPYPAFSRFLGLLREADVGGRRRRLYPSAGDTYAVQVYLHLRPEGVEGVPGGLYYYHPVEHALHCVNATPDLDRSAHFVYNRDTFDRAGFGLYLVGCPAAIEPVYGDDSERFLLLEAGYIGQLLMLGQASCGIGLCPIGTVAADPVREQFRLDARHLYLHAFLAGPAAPSSSLATTGERPLFSAGHQAAADYQADVPDGRADVAVIGAAGRFPGAEDLDTFWRNLADGTSSLSPVPQRAGGHLGPGGDGAPMGGFLPEIDAFDHFLFHVSPRDASRLDPQLRLLLHVVWECLETAGHTAASLNRAGRVGVFLAMMWQDYQHVGAERWQQGRPAAISATASEAANRISHFFGFHGPSVAIDTSCSSSLTALHMAVASLHRGECEAAVVAAANVLAHPYHLELLGELGLLTTGKPDGAFGAASQGWSAGEGAAALVLRPRSLALEDLDTTWAVIEGTRIGHLGGHGRFGSPDPRALAQSIADALDAAATEPADIGYVECAAAGATLADAAEIDALSQVFTAARDTPVLVGTVKPNIGHLEAAAGLSQVIKVLLQMRHGQIAPTLLSRQPSPLIRWDGMPIRPAGQLVSWSAHDRPLRALVNAVGATGSYGHVVLRAADPPAGRSADPLPGPHVVLLSAGSKAQLTMQVNRLRGHLLAQRADLADVAFTLQTGRAQLRHRLAITCSDLDELMTALERFGRGEHHPAVAAGTTVAVGSAAASGPSAPAPVTSAAVAGWLAGQDVDWSRYWPAGRAHRVPLPTYPFATDRPPGDHPASGAGRPWRGAAGVGDYLKEMFAEITGTPAGQVDLRRPLEHYGVSSYLITRLNERLERDLGEVSKTLFFEHADLAGVARALAGRTVPAGAETAAIRPEAAAIRPEAAARPAADGDPAGQRIAIIGMAGRYPQAADLFSFWQLLLEGRDAITPLPEGRRRPGWPAELMTGGFLDGVDLFDPLFFGIAPRDARSMDPQERLFLEVAWHALEDGGYTRARLRDAHHGRVGVFAGSMYNEYPFFGLDQAGGCAPCGSAIAGIANRLSYFLGLHGPSMTVDSMCSSALTAVHLAVTSIRRGECELAIVGGVNLSLHPNKFLRLRDLKMSATDHRCRSFGANGDGFVPGEGVGAILLKPFALAVADGDRIHAVIRGSAVNHDGKTNGYTVPNPVAQARLIAEALADAGVTPGDIGYVEAHGTGTMLGDPVEINGLNRAFTPAELPPGSRVIGSVKSNIGHLEAAAGIAGLTKAVLQLTHRVLVPSLHAEEPNPNIDWDHTPFRLQQRIGPWPDAIPRRAGISSFGAGGANAHVVVEECEPVVPVPDAEPGPHLMVLSARTEAQLAEMSARLASFLRARAEAGQPACLADVAYTLQVGREAMTERLAVVVSDAEDLCRQLEHLAGSAARSARASGPEAGDGTVLRGRAADRAAGQVIVPTPRDLAALASLARHWVHGGMVEWSGLHPGGHRRVVSLPGYPFARTRCWAAEPGGSVTQETAATRLYERRWRTVSGVPPSQDRGTAVICLHRRGHRQLADEITAALRPAQVVLLCEDDEYGNEATAASAARGLLDRHGYFTGWLDLCALPEEGVAGPRRDERDHGLWGARLATLQQVLLRKPPGGLLRVVQVTSGLLDPPDVPQPRPDLTGARLAGFVRSLGAEYSWVRANVVDVEMGPGTAGHIASAWRAAGEAGEIRVRGGVLYQPTLIETPGPVTPWRPDPDGVYVISGGTGGLGALTARHLARHGVRNLAILGLRSLPPRESWSRADLSPDVAAVVAQVQELERLGARVMPYGGTLTWRDRLAEFLAEVRQSLGPIAGVVHCAGRPATGPRSLVHKNLADILRVLEPKTDGLDALADVTSDDSLEFFLAFSSIAAAVPSLAAGMMDYAAANAYLDFFASYQIRTGRTAFRAVNWPVWRESGRAAGRADACASLGVGSLTDAEGLAVLDRVLGLPPTPSVLACPVLHGQFDPERLLRANRGAVHEGPAAHSVTAVPPPAWLVTLFSQSLDIPEADLDTATPFGDLGVESVLLAELLAKIEAKVGRPLEPAVLLDHPTLQQLSAYLAEAGAAADDHQAMSRPATVKPAGEPAPEADQRIAVIGMACRFPGAPDLASFWRMLRAGECAVTEVPATRWEVPRLYQPGGGPGRSISKWGGFVADLEYFDPALFGISDEEARDLDPAIRMTLEAAMGCLRDAGYRDDELAGKDVGVFVGARMSSYRRRISVGGAVSSLGGDQNFIASRVAHHYDFRGPNLVIDSACSSGLVAVQLACRSLLSGESVVALAGGAEVLLDEEPYLEFSAARALSPHGRCATFDRDADGFVPGEGCGMLLLERLDRAQRNGDRIHAVIDSVAVGSDGRTMGLTTPNPAAQAQVVRQALDLAGLRAGDVGMIEAHGTATMIGDPIELRALTDVFREQTARTGFCAIGSVKSNIGHLLSAAGIAGLIKALLALKHREIPPTLFCDHPNPRFDFAASPFFPNTRLLPWPRGPLVAGVSAFGLGGTNAHVVASAVPSGTRPGGRTPLPAPSFQRKRLWRDSRPVPSAPAGNGTFASVLDLRFVPGPTSRAQH